MMTTQENQNLNSLKGNFVINSELENALPSSSIEQVLSEGIEEDAIIEITNSKEIFELSKKSPNNFVSTENFLTMNGTIKRGKKKDENVQVVLNMSREELEILEANIMSNKGCRCEAEADIGIHIFTWSLICLPFSVITSLMYSFFLGTITWYNVFTVLSENKAFGFRILFPPLLIILYPFLIISISFGLGIYAGIKQLSCSWNSWLKEFTDYEKGFFGWLCNALNVPDCCPYEIIILSKVQSHK